MGNMGMCERKEEKQRASNEKPRLSARELGGIEERSSKLATAVHFAFSLC
jgi:hypothetical protein